MDQCVYICMGPPTPTLCVCGRGEGEGGEFGRAREGVFLFNFVVCGIYFLHLHEVTARIKSSLPLWDSGELLSWFSTLSECHSSVPSAIHQCRVPYISAECHTSVPCVSAERMTSSLCSGGLWLDLEVMVRGNGLDFFHFTGELDCMLRSNIKITIKKLKENRCEVAGWPENIERVQILHLPACSVKPGFLVWLQPFFFFFFASNLSSSGRILSSFFVSRNSGLVYDVADREHWTQNGSTHGSVFVTFNCRFSNQEDEKWSDKRLRLAI